MADQTITQLNSYTPPIDTDVQPIVDVTLGITKKITWANIKAALKTYFDGIYQAALAYTAENVANKDTTTTLGTSDTKYPSQKAVKTYVDSVHVGSFVGAHTNIVINSGDANVDTTFTPNFTAKNITIYYVMSGNTAGTQTFTVGQATFNGTSFVAGLNFQDNTSSASTTFKQSTMVFPTQVIVGGPSGAVHAQIIITVQSVSSTQFVVRCTGLQSGASSAIADFYVVATQ